MALVSNDVNNIIEKRCITMNGKDLLLRFILGGAAVAISYLVTVVSPWESCWNICGFSSCHDRLYSWFASLQVQEMRQM